MSYRRGKIPEVGAVKKDWGGRLSVALVFPNKYEVGMANLGFQAIYSLLNSFPDIVCERFFLECEGSIESGRPPSDFDVIAFSLPFELDWINAVNFLKRSKIPPLREERDRTHPLVIAGGISVTANPIPLSPFMDLFIIGDGEPVIPLFIEALREFKDDKEGLINFLRNKDGIWAGGRGRKAWTDINKFPIHTFIFSKRTEFRDMFLVEMERGCPFRCKFCLVGNISKPSRFLREDKVLDVASRGLELTKNIGLIGSSIDEHPDIEEIVRKLYKMGARISVSSLRIDRLKTPVLENIRRSGTRSITVAPEAGTERLRKLIGKGIRDEDIEEGAFKIKIAGIREVKLYFMFGIPGEDEGDIRAIRDVASKFRDVKLTINFSPFIPKAHTPFERLPMERKETLEEKIKLIRSLLKGYELKFESPSLSLLQGVLSRGDENVGRSILELERIREWERIIPSWEKYVYEELKGELPWDKIDVG